MTPADPSAAAAPKPAPTYQPRRQPSHRWVNIRGLEYHISQWGDPSLVTPQRPPLLLCHGFMDIGASFQFLVDAMADHEGERRYVLAMDWRGFGRTRGPATDAYWFPDYLADLDALLCCEDLGLDGKTPVDLLGHSMGGNIVMNYAGVQPARIRRLVNLEGFGLPRAEASEAPSRMARWLNHLRHPRPLRAFAGVNGVKARLQENNPRLPDERALWLAHQWAEPRDDGQWHILADEAHKNINPLVYRVEEVLACWARITAPVLWVEGAESETSRWWGDRFPREEFEARLAVVGWLERHTLAGAGHMLHHDQPDALARHLQAFLDLP
ncbi:alpha/beta fold hydrolase [Ideonella sp. B508-1]|uniref:alpha/beta fold hydrolase n=1 Tax=Ideonella sp. B508-1 TaxID=137716 RepID=UPI0003B3F6AA|nr:alpha/beta hydrolase [Ideonella sp. B508-1]